MPNCSSLDPGRQPAAPANANGADTGLLEQRALFVRPAEDGRSHLVSLAGGVVGFTRRQGQGIWGLWPWGVLLVHEQEQAPLVFTVRRRLSLAPRREVRDSEGDLVGVLAGASVFDRWQRLAMRLVAKARGGEFQDAQGRSLATWAEGPGGTRLDLLPAVWHDPFAKMLILAAFLTL